MNLAVNARDAMPQGRQADHRDRERRAGRGSTPRQHAGVQPGRYVLLAVTRHRHGHGRRRRRPASSSRSSPRRRRARGPGWAWPTVYGIVKQSGGHIWVYSELGQSARRSRSTCRGSSERWPDGPVPTRLRARRRGARRRSCWSRTRTRARRWRAAILSAQRLHGAGGAATARRRCAIARASTAGPIDLLLTDVVMPEMSGRELAERLARRAPGPEGAVHVRLHGRRGRPARRPAGGDGRSCRSRSRRPGWPRVREVLDGAL